MLKRYVQLNVYAFQAPMAPADLDGSDTADSLERFEHLPSHGQQQLDAPSNP